MTILTIDAIRENPWNAVYRELPEHPDGLLLKAAFCAVHYCRHSEFALMLAARQGDYTPAEWRLGNGDVHEGIEDAGSMPMCG